MPRQPCVLKYATSRVSLIGACTKLGHCLTLLLKQSSLISKMQLYDKSPKVMAFADDANFIDTNCTVSSHYGRKSALERAVQDSDIVVLMQGKGAVEGDPSRALDLYGKNVFNYARVVCEQNPKALVAVCCEPVECMLPIVVEVMKKGGWYDPGKIIGSCGSNEIRCNTAIARIMGLDPETIMVPLVGGTCGNGLVPIFSHAVPGVRLTQNSTAELLATLRLDIVDRACAPALPLLTAHGLRRFILSLAAGRAGVRNVLVNAFVRSDILNGSRYLTSPVILGPLGVAKVLNIPKLSEFEIDELSRALLFVNETVALGENYFRKRAEDAYMENIFPPDVLKESLKRRGIWRNCV